jgi:ribosomal protein S18 acetylase RimI-like enzyme
MAAFKRRSGPEIREILESLTTLYVEVHREARYKSDSMFSRTSFVSRIEVQATKPGFELVTAEIDDQIVGFSFGYTISPGAWWQDATRPPEELLEASKFAVIELEVQAEYRGHGLGKRLLRILLENRTESVATLAAMPSSPAYAMYRRWGWTKVGDFTDGPPMDTLALQLP